MTAATGQNSPAEGLLPDESAVLPLSTQENFSVAARVLGRETRRHLLGDLRLRAARRPARRRGRGRPARAARPARGRARPRLRRRAGAPADARGSRRPCASCGLPRGPFERLIDANRRDQVQARYATFDDLVDYCDAVRESGRRARAVRLRRGDARADRALGPRLHGAAARRALAGRRRGLPAAAASTCRPRTCERFGVDRRRPRRARDRRRAARAARRSRSIARGALLDEGAPLVGTLRGRARFAVAGLRRRRARERRARSSAPGTTCSPGRRRRASAARVRETLACWRRGR